MKYFLFAFLNWYFIQDTSFVKKDTDKIILNESINADTTIIAKKKKRKIDSSLIKENFKNEEILLQRDSVIYFFSSKKKYYFGEIDDTQRVFSIQESSVEKNDRIVYDIQQTITLKKKYWIFYVMLFSSLMFVYVRLNFYKYLQDTIRSFFNLNIAQQFFREQESGLTLSGLMLNLIFVINFSLYLFLIADFFQIDTPFSDIKMWLTIGAGITLIYLLKNFFLSLSTIFFPISNEVNFYKFNVFLFNKIIGIILVFIVLVIAFAKIFIVKITVILSLFLLGLILIYRFFRGFFIARDYLMFNKFHFFLYLCIFEIVPFIIFLKLLMDWNKA